MVDYCIIIELRVSIVTYIHSSMFVYVVSVQIFDNALFQLYSDSLTFQEVAENQSENISRGMCGLFMYLWSYACVWPSVLKSLTLLSTKFCS